MVQYPSFRSELGNWARETWLGVRQRAPRKVVGDDKSPARWLITGIVDEKEPGVPV